jgi:hypothetical protein
MCEFGMALGEVGTGGHGGQENHAEALMTLRPIEGCHSLPETVDCPLIVALGLVGLAEEVVRPRMQDDLPTGCGEREGALGGSDGLAICAYKAEMV